MKNYDENTHQIAYPHFKWQSSLVVIEESLAIGDEHAHAPVYRQSFWNLDNSSVMSRAF